MSAPFELSAAAAAIRASARHDAGAATVMAERYVADYFARSIGLPAGAYAVSTDGVRLFAGWQDAERILVVREATVGEAPSIVNLPASDPNVLAAPADADFGLAGADEGRLAADLRLDERQGTAIDALALDHYRLVAEALRLAVILGTLDGFLEQALGFLRARSRPWYGANIERATDDPHALRTVGLLFSRRNALDELATRSFATIENALRGEPAADAGREIDLARHYAQRLARSLINEGIGVLGASSASGRHGFDRFWRDAAAHGLRHPPRRDAEALGRDFIIKTRAAS